MTGAKSQPAAFPATCKPPEHCDNHFTYDKEG